jgi:hypothetical protein
MVIMIVIAIAIVIMIGVVIVILVICHFKINQRNIFIQLYHKLHLVCCLLLTFNTFPIPLTFQFQQRTQREFHAIGERCVQQERRDC